MAENVNVEEPIKKKLKIFGLDMSNDPCARNSLIYGISGSMICSVLYNVFTRKAPYGVSIGVLGVILFGSYIPCKYIQHRNEKFKKQLEPLLTNYGKMTEEERAKLDQEWASLAMLNNKTDVRNFRSDAEKEKKNK